MGFAVGPVCFRETVDAASAFCSSVSGMTSLGFVSCKAPIADASGVVSFTLVTASSGGMTETPSEVVLAACRPFDLQETAPIFAAGFLALVTILAARSLYTRIFRQQP